MECIMNRHKARKTARHEAGHVVMRWYLELSATRSEIFNEEEGLTSGSGKMIDMDIAKYLLAAGAAAEYRNWPAHFEFIMLCYKNGRVDYRKAEDDFDELWHIFAKFGCYPNGIIYNQCIESYYQALKVIRHYRSKVDEVTELLLAHGCVTEPEAKDLFARWGKPGDVYASYKSVSRHFVDVSDDLEIMLGDSDAARLKRKALSAEQQVNKKHKTDEL